MIRFRFGHEDLVRTRFAISPLFDLTWSTDVLRDPAAHSLHLPWARAARRRLEGFDYELLDLLATSSARGYVPDFLAPPPTTPLAELDDELARVRATPPARVALEIGWRFEGMAVPAAARMLLDDPQRGLAELTTMMARLLRARDRPVVAGDPRRARERHPASRAPPDRRWRDRGLRGPPRPGALA